MALESLSYNNRSFIQIDGIYICHLAVCTLACKLWDSKVCFRLLLTWRRETLNFFISLQIKHLLQSTSIVSIWLSWPSASSRQVEETCRHLHLSLNVLRLSQGRPWFMVTSRKKITMRMKPVPPTPQLIGSSPHTISNFFFVVPPKFYVWLCESLFMVFFHILWYGLQPTVLYGIAGGYRTRGFLRQPETFSCFLPESS